MGGSEKSKAMALGRLVQSLTVVKMEETGTGMMVEEREKEKHMKWILEEGFVGEVKNE